MTENFQFKIAIVILIAILVLLWYVSKKSTPESFNFKYRDERSMKDTSAENFGGDDTDKPWYNFDIDRLRRPVLADQRFMPKMNVKMRNDLLGNKENVVHDDLLHINKDKLPVKPVFVNGVYDPTKTALNINTIDANLNRSDEKKNPISADDSLEDAAARELDYRLSKGTGGGGTGSVTEKFGLSKVNPYVATSNTAYYGHLKSTDINLDNVDRAIMSNMMENEINGNAPGRTDASVAVDPILGSLVSAPATVASAAAAAAKSTTTTTTSVNTSVNAAAAATTAAVVGEQYRQQRRKTAGGAAPSLSKNIKSKIREKFAVVLDSSKAMLKRDEDDNSGQLGGERTQTGDQELLDRYPQLYPNVVNGDFDVVSMEYTTSATEGFSAKSKLPAETLLRIANQSPNANKTAIDRDIQSSLYQ